MAQRLNRAHLVRAAVAVAAVAVPLGAAGSAQAAIAGASPASTTALPDLVSATSTGTSSISACYDKALNTSSAALATPGDLYVTNYLSGASLAGTSEQLAPVSVTLNTSNPDCLNLQFNPQAGALSLGQGTAVTSIAGAVTAATGNGQSLADSTTLTSSTSHVGTAGVTAGPDLSSSAIYAGSNSSYSNAITYTFDQNVDPTAANVTGSDFFYEAADGTVEKGSTALAPLVSGNTVTVQFGASGPISTTNPAPTGDASVKNALQTGATADAVYSVINGTAADEVGNQNSNVALTGTGTGTTALPTLISAALSNNYTAVTYTFDHQINTTTIPGDFEVALSDGSDITGAGDTVVVSGNTATVTYGTALSNIAEYAVQAVVQNSTVSLSSAAAPVAGTASNTPGGVAIGGNAGAFARGFTTGPDVVSAVNEGSGVVQVTIDQRVGLGQTNGLPKIDLANIDLLNAAGQNVDAAQSSEESQSPAPGSEVIDLVFASTVTNGTQIQFNTDSFDTGLSSGDGVNIPQIVSISGGSAARVHSAHVKKHAKKHSKKHAKKA